MIMRHLIEGFLIFSIRLYQAGVSPYFPSCCRFYPTCSEYAIMAIKAHGPFKGSIIGLMRITRCHPFNPGGYDPVKK